MRHSIALVTGTTSGLGYAAARMLAAEGCRQVITGSEAARGDFPTFSYTDVAALAAKHHQGDRTAAVEALLRSGSSVKYAPHRAYADAKCIVAWWAAALARRLPSGMAVYTVSPGDRGAPSGILDHLVQNHLRAIGLHAL